MEGLVATEDRRQLRFLTGLVGQVPHLPTMEDAAMALGLPSTGPADPVEFAERVARVPLQAIRLGGSSVDILLPASGPSTESAWSHYLDRLERANLFPDQRDAIRKLRKLPFDTVPVDTGQPTIAVVINEPKKLEPNQYFVLEKVRGLFEGHGCRVLLIPPCADVAMDPSRDERAAGILAMARQADGIFGTGGPDLHPWIYREPIQRSGKAPTDNTRTHYPRDRFEVDFHLASTICASFKFMVCRSHQLANAMHGTKLDPDIQGSGRSSIDRWQPNHGLSMGDLFELIGPDGQLLSQPVRFPETSAIVKALGGRNVFPVNAFHHQAVIPEPGKGLPVVGVVSDPGTHQDLVYATEDLELGLVTTQFHPEFRLHAERELQMLSMLPRRAKVFRMLKQLGDPAATDPDQLMEAARKAGIQLDASDAAWLRRDLPDQLAHIQAHGFGPPPSIGSPRGHAPPVRTRPGGVSVSNFKTHTERERALQGRPVS